MKQLLPLALTLVAMLSSACRSTSVNTVEPAEPAGSRQMLSDQRVLADTTLAKAVKVLGVNTATDEAGFLRVQIEIQNTTRSRKNFTYRVDWFDRDGMLIQRPSDVAIPRSLEGRGIGYINITAPNDRAKDFRIQFLEPVS